MKQVVSYLRVSTQRQGRSGLGLEAQQNAVATFCKEHGCGVIREFREVESGRKNDRRVLREAIRYAKQTKSVLLIAKIDRLARNVAFIANLMETDVQFRACDLPEANRLLLHIMAAIAEHEAQAIAQRTRESFAEAKKRGSRLGATNPNSRNLTPDARVRGAESTKAQAANFYADVMPIILKMRARGLSLAQIAGELTEAGYTLRSGARWNAVQVSRLLDRAA